MDVAAQLIFFFAKLAFCFVPGVLSQLRHRLVSLHASLIKLNMLKWYPLPFPSLFTIHSAVSLKYMPTWLTPEG